MVVELGALVRKPWRNGVVTALPLAKLARYYEHLAELAEGYKKDAAKLEENLKHVNRWRDEVKELGKVF